MLQFKGSNVTLLLKNGYARKLVRVGDRLLVASTCKRCRLTIVDSFARDLVELESHHLQCCPGASDCAIRVANA